MRIGSQQFSLRGSAGYIAFTALLCASQVGAAADNPFTQLSTLHAPERQQLHTPMLARSASTAHAHQVQMKQGSFYLDPNYIPELTSDSGYLLLQMQGALSDQQRAELDALGVSLLDYIPDHTWVSHITRDNLPQLHGLSYVRAMGNIYPSDKLPPHLLAHGLSPYAQHDGGVSLQISFFSGVEFDDAVTALNAIQATTHQSEYMSGQRIDITLPTESVLALVNMESVRWIEEPPRPIASENTASADQIGVSELHSGAPSLKGDGIIIAGWEGGVPQTNHPDLQGRITIAQGSGAPSRHATHVVGTLIGSGANNPSARGMAPQASYIAYDFYGDVAQEMHNARLNYSAKLHNHSWGYISGWSSNYYGDGKWVWFGSPSETVDSDFGRYGTTASQWDAFIELTDGLVVKSAGNNRNDHGPGSHQGHYHHGDSNTLHYDYHGSDGDFDSIDSASTAKNVITVGAVDTAGQISSFSGWGPTDDGRLKPDVVANGVSVYSTSVHSGYSSMTGSSMSTPAVSGALALLSELNNEINGHHLRASTAKALVAHTAQDEGEAGPDYKYGWGVMNAKAASELIKLDNGNGSHIRIPSIQSGGEYNFPVTVAKGDQELKATIAWTDAAGTPYASKALINDLDLILIDPNGVAYHPYTLSPANPNAPALQDKPNRLDNVEQVRVAHPTPGRWQIKVKGYKVIGAQTFSLVSTTGLNDSWNVEGHRSLTSTSSGSGGGGGSLGALLVIALAGLSLRRLSA